MNVRPVLHIVSGLGVGGAEVSLVQIATALQARGFPQHVICVGSLQSIADQLRSNGVEVTVLGIKSAAALPGGIIRIARYIRGADPGVVQGWMYHGNLLAALAHGLAGRRSERRLFWNLRASNMEEDRYTRVIRLSAMFSRWPDLIIANSVAGAKFHIGRGYASQRMIVVGNGVDTEKFRPDAEARAAIRSELSIPTHSVVVIHAARVDPMKDHSTFLSAMAKLPHLRGILVGSGTETLSLPENVRALGLRQDMAKLYAAADIVVSSSAFGEGFSNVIAEGMSAGLIPVATDVGDAGEIIGDSGYLVAPGKPAALADALTAAATGPALERIARGARARERVIKEFPQRKTVETYMNLYYMQHSAPHRPAAAPIFVL